MIGLLMPLPHVLVSPFKSQARPVRYQLTLRCT